MTKVGDTDRTEKFDLYSEWRSVELVERLCREAGRKIVYIMHDKKHGVRVNGIEGTFNSDRHDLRDLTRAWVDLRTEGVAVFVLDYDPELYRGTALTEAQVGLVFDFCRDVRELAEASSPKTNWFKRNEKLGLSRLSKLEHLINQVLGHVGDEDE